MTWANIKIAGVAALVFMGYWIKYLLSKNARLEHKDKINDKLKEIRENQESFIEKVSEDEARQIDEIVKSNPVSDDDSFLDGL